MVYLLLDWQFRFSPILVEDRYKCEQQGLAPHCKSMGYQNDLHRQYQIFWCAKLLPSFVPKFSAVYAYHQHAKQNVNMIVVAPVCHGFFVKAVLYLAAIQMDSGSGRHQVVARQIPSGNPMFFFWYPWALKYQWARNATAFKRFVHVNWLGFVSRVCLCWLRIKGGSWKSTIYRRVYSHQSHLQYVPSHAVLLERGFPVPFWRSSPTNEVVNIYIYIYIIWYKVPSS